MGRPRVVNFGYMGRYWSLPVAAFDALLALIEADKPFDLNVVAARQLARRPRRVDYERVTMSDADMRGEH